GPFVADVRDADHPVGADLALQRQIPGGKQRRAEVSGEDGAQFGWRHEGGFGARNARPVLLRKRVLHAGATERILEGHAGEGESRRKRRDIRKWIECARLDRRVEMAEAAAEAGLVVLRQPVSETNSWTDVPDVGVRPADRAPGIMMVP